MRYGLPRCRRLPALALTLALSATAVLADPPAPPAAAAASATPAPPNEDPVAEAPPAVAVVQPQTAVWPVQVEASGYVMPWQESRIGVEVGGLRLAAVLVGVGDTVSKGQVLARLDAAAVEADVDAAAAQLAEAEATLTQAKATLERARRLVPSGGVSQQELTQYETQKHTADARVSAARAQFKRQQLKLGNATIVAPDDGVIAASSASEGAVVSAGSELFRIIRKGRLELRAEVAGETLLRLAPGQEVTVRSPLGNEVRGRVRQLAPTVDLTTHNGLAYIDLPPGVPLKAGLYVRGSIVIGERTVLALPESTLQQRGDAARVLTVDAAGRVAASEVRLGAHRDGMVEILAGLDARDRVVVADAGAVAVGETVRPEAAPADARR